VTHWLSFMTRNHGSRLAYLWRAWLAVMLGTALIAALAVLVFPVAETAQEAPPPPFPGVVLLWPAVPSLALWGVLEVLRRALPTYWHAAGGAGVCRRVHTGLRRAGRADLCLAVFPLRPDLPYLASEL